MRIARSPRSRYATMVAPRSPPRARARSTVCANPSWLPYSRLIRAAIRPEAGGRTAARSSAIGLGPAEGAEEPREDGDRANQQEDEDQHDQDEAHGVRPARHARSACSAH